MDTLTREHFVACMKRRDAKSLGAIILKEIYGEEENAKELLSANRLTLPLIDRTCVKQEEPEEVDGQEEPEEVDGQETPEQLTYDDDKEASNPVEKTYDDIKKAIKKGKRKKALKLIGVARADGSSGSELDKLETKAKSL